MYWGIFFSSKHKAKELVATERSSKCILLMECPHLLHVELNMLVGGVEQYITLTGVWSPSQPGLCEGGGHLQSMSWKHPLLQLGLHMKQVSSDCLGVAFGC